MSTKLYTIGFTKKSAEEFFGMLKKIDISPLIDIRLSNQSQLTGFSKGRDLPYFMREICNAGYLHLPEGRPPRKSWTATRRKRA